MTPPLDTNKGEPMKTLSEILDPILVKLYYNGYTDRIAGITEHAEAVKNNWLSEAQEAIAKELMGCLPEKYRMTNAGHPCPACNAEQGELHTDCPIEHAQKITKVAHDSALDEVRARLTAFIEGGLK